MQALNSPGANKKISYPQYIAHTCSVQIIPRPIVTGESIVAWDESFIPVSNPIGQVPQNITKQEQSVTA